MTRASKDLTVSIFENLPSISRYSIMYGQDKFIMRESDDAEVGVCEDCDEDLLDVGCSVVIF